MSRRWRQVEVFLWFFLAVFADTKRGWKTRRTLIKLVGRELGELTDAHHLTQFVNLARMRPLLRYASWIPRKLIGWDLNYLNAAENPRTIYGEAISLFGLVITSGVALTVSQQQATVRPAGSLFLAYAAAVVTVLAGLVTILNAKHEPDESAKRRGPPAKHAYERGSIMFTRTILLGSFAIAVLFGTMAWIGLLPGQTFSIEKEGVLEFPQEHTFKDKTKGVVVPVRLGNKLFPNGIPPQLNMRISITSDLRKTWEIEQVIGYHDEDGKEKRMETQPAAVVTNDKSAHGEMTMLLDQLNRDGRYVFKVYLHGTGKVVPAEKDVVDAIERIRTSSAMRVVFLSKDK